MGGQGDIHAVHSKPGSQQYWEPNLTVFILSPWQWLQRTESALCYFLSLKCICIKSTTGKLLKVGVAGRHYVVKSGNKVDADLNTF